MIPRTQEEMSSAYGYGRCVEYLLYGKAVAHVETVAKVMAEQEKSLAKIRELLLKLEYQFTGDESHDCHLDNQGTGHCDHSSHKETASMEDNV